MKYEVKKLYNGNLEFIYGDKTVLLTDTMDRIIITDDEYMQIPKEKMYLITSGFIAITMIDEEPKVKSKHK